MKFIRRYSLDDLKECGFVIVDGRGLILGPSHSEGGIEVWVPLDDDGTSFQCVGEIEGGEYVSSPYSLHLNKDALMKYNECDIDSGYISEEEAILANKLGVPVYDLRNSKKKIVLNHKNEHLIIRHQAVKLYLNEIFQLDLDSERSYFASLSADR